MFGSKIFRFILILLLLIALGIGIYYLGLWLRWPLWFAASVYLLLVGLGFGIVFLRRWLFRRKERKFVERVVQQDISRLPVEEEEQSHLEMEKRFLSAVDVLKTSAMSNQGNPVYALPWCMVLGESNSGKTMALRRSNLSAIQTQFTSIGSPTSSCDWWFSSNAVILDMAGRFSEFGEDVRVRREWESFLTLLAKHRYKEPLNALVLAVSVERLMGDAEQLDDYAKTLRRRINEIMRVVGARFPVYLLVTKMDLVPGFNSFTEQMDPSARKQALGAINSDEILCEQFTADCLSSLAETLRDFRVIAANAKQNFDLTLLALPEKLNLLEGPLRRFASTLFSQNPYLETPLFRGLFFGSAKANDEKFANAPMTVERGAFLHDLFATIIPRERYLFTPVREMLKWRTQTAMLGWGAWLLICLCLTGMLSVSFMENKRALNDIAHQFRAIAETTPENTAAARLLAMDRMSGVILDMEKVNTDWFMPRMGLNQSLEGEQRVKASFGRIFADSLQKPSDIMLLHNVDSVSTETPEELIPLYIEHLLWRIDVLKKGVGNASIEELDRDRPAMKPAMTQNGLGLPAGSGALYANLYLRNIAWNSRNQNLEQQLRAWQNALGSLVTSHGSRLTWITDWANANPVLKPVTMQQFWGRNQFIVEKDLKVPSAFTLEGKLAIGEFLIRLRTASADPQKFAEAETVFWDAYRQQYFAAWYAFANAAPTGAEIRIDTSEMRLMAGQIAGIANPYFMLLEKMCQQLEPIAMESTPPPWYGAMRHFPLVLADLRLKNAPTTPSSILSDATHMADRLSASMDTAKKALTQELKTSSEQLEAYLTAVNDMIPAVASNAAAFQFVAKVLRGPDVTTGVSYQIHRAKQNLDAFVNLGQENASPELFARLVGGPYSFFHDLLTRQSIEELQRIWEADVYTPSIDVEPERAYQMMCDPSGGSVPRFLEGDARNFVVKRGNRYSPAAFMESPLPLASDFLTFLDCPVTAPPSADKEYRVTLDAQPTTVNEGAKDIPYLTNIRLYCDNKPEQLLENYNNRTSATFQWKYDSCNTATLEIAFNSLTVTREFQGPRAFPRLLQLFQSGKAVFTPESFPTRQAQLRELGISRITVGVQMHNAAPVTGFVAGKKIRVPREVASQEDEFHARR